MARTGKKISQLWDEVYDLTGRLYALEVDVPATPEMKIVLPRQLQEVAVEQVDGHRVTRTSNMDGTKFYLENDNWMLLRFSGTESLLRISCEADTPRKAEALIEWGKELIHLDAFSA